MNPDFVAYAENCDAGDSHRRPAEPDGGLEEALAYDGPALVERLTDANPV